MSPGQTGHITGQMGRVPGTDGTHTRGCPAKILYVYWFSSFPNQGLQAHVCAGCVFRRVGTFLTYVCNRCPGLYLQCSTLEPFSIPRPSPLALRPPGIATWKCTYRPRNPKHKKVTQKTFGVLATVTQDRFAAYLLGLLRHTALLALSRGKRRRSKDNIKIAFLAHFWIQFFFFFFLGHFWLQNWDNFNLSGQNVGYKLV